jgi:hypothetical protein
MKTSGLIIFVIGVAMLILTRFDFFTKEKLVDLGSVEISHNKKHDFNWPPLAGILVMAVGTGVYFFGKKSNMKITR